VNPTAVTVTPFQIGWKVLFDAPGRGIRETVTGRREVALEVAQYHAAPRALDVVVYREDGSVEQMIPARASA